MSKGKLFVIDGTDGSGKQTQLNKLKERLEKENIKYKLASFPNYDSPSSSLVKMYLSGEFGENAKDVSPYIASTFFAADRYATFKTTLEEFYNNGGIILADRYTTSNMIHQAGKIKDDEERKKFLDWLWDFEFNLYGLPIPTKTFFLNMPTEYAIKLMEQRENKFTHTQKKDIHEKDGYYVLSMEAPGVKKEDIQIELKDGYLKVTASRNSSKEDKDEKGRIIRQERYSGSSSRSFYVGEGIKQEDVKANFDNGELIISIPTETKKVEEETKFIPIL